jgi:hypothetical protein
MKVLQNTDHLSREVTSMQLHEASMNFDTENVPLFLTRIAKLVESGFGTSEAERVLQDLKDLSPDQEAMSEFQVVFRGESVALKVKIVLDDIDAPNLCFFSSKAVADAIQQEMIRFAEEKGL